MKKWGGVIKMFDLYKQIRRIEKALGLKPAKIEQMNLTYYEELFEKISEWEEENQRELIY